MLICLLKKISWLSLMVIYSRDLYCFIVSSSLGRFSLLWKSHKPVIRKAAQQNCLKFATFKAPQKRAILEEGWVSRQLGILSCAQGLYKRIVSTCGVSPHLDDSSSPASEPDAGPCHWCLWTQNQVLLFLSLGRGALAEQICARSSSPQPPLHVDTMPMS